MNGLLLEIMVKDLHDLPSEWKWFRLECFPKGEPRLLYVEIAGAVAPLFKTGKRKGRHNWKNKDKGTVRTFAITPDEYDTYCKRYIEKTGNCIDCLGDKREVASISVANGTIYRQCRKCKGTGKATP